MTTLQPPLLATAILERSRVDPVLVGDLVEQYQGGRSAFWYWAQVPRAVASAAVTDIRRHYVLAGRAFLLALIAPPALSFVIEPLSRLGVIANNWLLEAGHDALRWWWWRLQMPVPAIDFVVFFLVAWLISRLHRPYSIAMVAVYSVWLLCLDAKLLMNGPIVSYLNHLPFLVTQSAWFLATTVVTEVVAVPLGAFLGAGPPDANPRPEQAGRVTS